MATGNGERDVDSELAAAVHQVLTTLTDLRSEVRAHELSDRIALVRWLRQELTAVETLLTGVYGRRAGEAHGPDGAVG
ncbi:MAG TPA: hypothetical protein VGP36_01760 [Mycobacteriales bacterium]|nr:hypothetical protein [Mycobacteriales bacterium]